jgi:hypothetical protein
MINCCVDHCEIYTSCWCTFFDYLFFAKFIDYLFDPLRQVCSATVGQFLHQWPVILIFKYGHEQLSRNIFIPIGTVSRNFSRVLVKKVSLSFTRVLYPQQPPPRIWPSNGKNIGQGLIIFWFLLLMEVFGMYIWLLAPTLLTFDVLF